MGIAPQVNLISVKVSDDNGGAAVSDVVNGLQWVYTNAATYNIRVVNLSLNSTVADSYQVDPLDAAVETLWNAGIVVVASAGNNGSTNAGTLFAPANDPFVITVGAVNDQGTATTADDAVASFSAFGTVPVSTTVGSNSAITKPDLVAPGVNIVSDLASSGDTLAVAHPDHVVTYNGCTCYFRMSGTSMAAPMVAGAAALLLQARPTLTPNQVKYRLTATATPLGVPGSGAGEVNVAGAIQSASTASANQNLALAAALQPGKPAASWGSASWGSASWGSASWGSASWGSASWGSASWGSASWGSASWGSDYWGT
jgi:serine protease AprX